MALHIPTPRVCSPLLLQVRTASLLKMQRVVSLAVTSVTIDPQPATPAAPAVTPTQPTCAVATGTITVTAPAPAAGITYSIDGTTYTNTTGVFTTVAPGTIVSLLKMQRVVSLP